MDLIVPYLLLILVGGAISVIVSDPTDKLLLASIVTRHGMRTPKKLFPNDPYQNTSYWPEGMMMLTAEGAQQMKKLGTIIRERYGSYLPEKYMSDILLARSTNTSRTLKSASSLLSGLYPGESVPIFSSAHGCDDLFFSYKNCPEYDIELKNILDNEEYQREEKKRKHLYTFLSNKLGKNIDKLVQIGTVFQNFLIEEMRGLKLPDWSKDIYPEPVAKLNAESLVISARTPLSIRLRHGPLIKDILENSELIDTGAPFKINLYSAHDLNIAGILSAMNLYDGNDAPGFSSAIIMELYLKNTTREKYLRIFYRVDNNTDFVELSKLECGGHCSLDFMMKYLKSIIPKNIQHECKRSLSISNGDIEGQRWDSQSALILMCACLGSAALGIIFVIALSQIYKNIYGYEDMDDTHYRKKMNIIRHQNQYYYQSL